MYKTIGIAIVTAAGLLAQTPVAPKDAGPQVQTAIRIGDAAEFGPIGITTAMAGPMATVAGAPYSAQAVTERVQTLADGNRIEQSTSGTVARDSQGRVRRDEGLPGLSSANGEAPHLVMIDDPVAGVHWTLDAQNKIAIKMQSAQMKGAAFGPFMPPPVGADKTWFFSAGPAPGPNVQVIAKNQSSSNSTVSKVDLGTQTIEGVPAQGTRTTRTIPAGAVGNEQPLVITTETWYSPDLKVLVLSKTSDPRMGETTYKLTNIERSEPPANLFQVPDDYTVKDQPGNTFFFRETKKNQ
ncbi:MAG TPA: hypothetical protein VMF91_13330 [Bryobacteraceae bacterium]|nr:hypothetical protein [Bryobacteraceae bacterium]